MVSIEKEYEDGEFCKDIKCPVFLLRECLPSELPDKDLNMARFQSLMLCKSCMARIYHDWLKDNDYSIVKINR